MSFNNNDFIEFLEYYKNPDNYEGKKVFDSITNISKSSEGNPLIDCNDIKIFNLDLLTEIVLKKNLPATCDGMYFKKGKLHLVEFKGITLREINKKNQFKYVKEKLIKQQCKNTKETCPINSTSKDLDELYEHYSSEVYNKLIIKPTESLFFALPKIYEDYCEKINKDYDHTAFISWLLNVKKQLMIVLKNDDSNLSTSNKHLKYEKSLTNKYTHLKTTVNMENKIYNETQFNEIISQYFES